MYNTQTSLLFGPQTFYLLSWIHLFSMNKFPKSTSLSLSSSPSSPSSTATCHFLLLISYSLFKLNLLNNKSIKTLLPLLLLPFTSSHSPHFFIYLNGTTILPEDSQDCQSVLRTPILKGDLSSYDNLV